MTDEESSYTCYMGLGTNLGNKEENLAHAMQQIEKQIGRILSQSAFYVTAPWGFQSSHSFLNAAIGVETSLPLTDVLQLTQSIERDMGRLHKSADGVYSDRVIDIDLLLAFHSDGTPLLMDTPALRLPHPLMHLRRFVMEPLAEIAPAVVHPLLGQPLSELLRQLPDY